MTWKIHSVSTCCYICKTFFEGMAKKANVTVRQKRKFLISNMYTFLEPQSKSGSGAVLLSLAPPSRYPCITGKDPNAGKDWRQEKKGTTENEMVGWHHRLEGHEFEQAPGDGEGQGSWHAAVHGVAKSRILISNWTELIPLLAYYPFTVTPYEGWMSK